jgi:hypothetical protein
MAFDFLTIAAFKMSEAGFKMSEVGTYWLMLD